MLRRMSLTADVLSHGVLPGVAAGFLLAGLSLPAMAFGGLLAGLVVALGAGALSRATGGREDAALAALYLVALAAGVLLVSLRGGPAELTHILFGSALGIDDDALLLMAGTASVTLPALAFAWRPLVLECFDPDFARAVGARGGIWHLGFLALVVLNLIAAFQALALTDPQSETRANVLADSGVAIDGDIVVPHRTTALFKWAFVGAMPYVLKLPQGADAAMRECRLIDAVGAAGDLLGNAHAQVGAYYAGKEAHWVAQARFHPATGTIFASCDYDGAVKVGKQQ
jgi:zinc/manganese transport system permease protein